MIRIIFILFELIVCFFPTRIFTLFLLAAFAATSAHAAAHLKTNGSTVDPIQYIGSSAYNGNLSTGNMTNKSKDFFSDRPRHMIYKS